MSIKQAEELREKLADRLEWMKAEDYRMDTVDWGGQEGALIAGNDAEMFFGLLCEWILTTKELIAGPLTAADMNETNAARVHTRMKYAFVRIPKTKTVVCIPRDEYDALHDVYKAAIIGRMGPKIGGAAQELAFSKFYEACAEYPPVLHLDFE